MNTIILSLVIMLSAVDPQDKVYYVDLIEYHTFIDNEGRFVFDQYIFYTWKYNTKFKEYRYEVVDWRLARIVEDHTPKLEQQQREINIEWHKTHKSGKFILWPDIIRWQLSHTKTQNGYDFLLVFNDPKNGGRVTKVRSKLFRDVWGNYDPELREREFLPEKEREHILPTK